MAITRKNQPAESSLPVALVELTERAATYKVTSEFFADRYNAVRLDVLNYLDRDDCPVQAKVGTGGGVTVPGVAGYSFTQPERVNSKAAIPAIVEALKSGALHPDALLEIISTVSKDATLKALGETAKQFVTTSEDVVTTMRVDKGFAADVSARLEQTVAETEQRVEVAA